MPTVSVYIPTPYRVHTGGTASIELQADTVGELLDALVARHPGLRDRLLTADGGLPPHLNVFVGEDEVRALQGLKTPLPAGAEVALVPAIAGGDAGVAAAERAPLLTDEQMERYSRHIRLDEVGVTGQRRLLEAKVVVIGAGGLGSPAALYLAAAGVGTIGIVDDDVVDLSNLQRQILHFNHDRGRPKTQSARRHLEDINPDVRVVEHRAFLSSANALQILRDYDVVINGSDNFATRYLVNDACVMLRKPLVDASILRFEGQATAFLPGRGCYRCLFPNPPPPGSVPNCAEAGIIGALAGHMGTLQAMEAIKIVLGVGEPLANRLLLYDALAGTYRTVRWRRREDCAVCGDSPTITELIDYEAFCGLPSPAGVLAAGDRRQGEAADGAGIDLSPERVAALLAADEVDVVDVREPAEFERRHIPGSRVVPASEINARSGELRRDRDTVLVCRIGEVSSMVAEVLRDQGFSKVYNLRGGLAAWVNHGLPLEGTATPSHP